ncbi:leucyl aminopeptidase [Chloroflexi bacterium TSY]|nr:leucyl aminopeptidase [Chloroflexi bacterium TSY]
MKLVVSQGNITHFETDCIVVNLFEGVTVPGGATGAVDQALNGAIKSLITTGDFTGASKTTALLYTNGQLPASRVLIVGLGKQDDFDQHVARRAAALATKTIAKLKGVNSFATIVHGAGIAGMDVEVAAQMLAEGTLLASYQAPQYRRKQNESTPAQCMVIEFDESKLASVQKGIQAGLNIARGVHSARDYISEPPNILYPIEFARRAHAMAEETGLSFSVLDESKMQELNMGILLAVSQGSTHEAQMIILEHAPCGTENENPLILVGKGITFDTGGISLKPGANMWEMKSDMSGAAAVVGAMESIARLQIQRRVIGIATCVENMPDGSAYRPGDILTGITGKTTEIISTDAEGRLILADTLGYLARFDPSGVVDLATLTGAIGIALGPQAAGLFSNSEGLQKALMVASEKSGERLWPMPMFDEYKEAIKSDMAEVKNSGGRFGGVATSAKFLEHFTEGYPWAHLDIAEMAWTKSNSDPQTPKGAVGFGVRLLVDLAEKWGS